MQNNPNEAHAELLQRLDDIVSKLAKLEQSVAQTYQQVEAFVSLTQALNPRIPLPPMRGWAISPDYAMILWRHLQRYHPQTIVELGGGVSTLVAGYALEQHQSGKIISIDHSHQFSQLTQQQVTRHALTDYVQFILAPLASVERNGEEWEWYDIAQLAFEAEIDLLVVDGPPQFNNAQRMARYLALPTFFDRLKVGGFILLDDANRDDEVAICERWLSEYAIQLVDDFYTEKGAKLFVKN